MPYFAVNERGGPVFHNGNIAMFFCFLTIHPKVFKDFGRSQHKKIRHISYTGI